MRIWFELIRLFNLLDFTRKIKVLSPIILRLLEEKCEKFHGGGKKSKSKVRKWIWRDDDLRDKTWIKEHFASHPKKTNKIKTETISRFWQ